MELDTEARPQTPQVYDMTSENGRPPWPSGGEGRRTRRGGQRGRADRVNRKEVLDAVENDADHEWKMLMTQGLHQLMGKCRKADGQNFDTWLFPSNHQIAISLVQAQDEFYAKVTAKRAERASARAEER